MGPCKPEEKRVSSDPADESAEEVDLRPESV